MLVRFAVVLAAGGDQRIATHRLLQLLQIGTVFGQRAGIDPTHWSWSPSKGPWRKKWRAPGVGGAGFLRRTNSQAQNYLVFAM